MLPSENRPKEILHQWAALVLGTPTDADNDPIVRTRWRCKKQREKPGRQTVGRKKRRATSQKFDRVHGACFTAAVQRAVTDLAGLAQNLGLIQRAITPAGEMARALAATFTLSFAEETGGDELTVEYVAHLFGAPRECVERSRGRLAERGGLHAVRMLSALGGASGASAAAWLRAVESVATEAAVEVQRMCLRSAGSVPDLPDQLGEPRSGGGEPTPLQLGV